MAKRYFLATTGPLHDDRGKVTGLYGIARDITELNRAEAALRESEAFTQAVLDNLPLGIAVNAVDPAVAFSYMNDDFPRLYRATREQLADPDAFWEVVYQDPAFRRDIRQRILEDCASGDVERMYWRDVPIARKGESTTYISARNIPLPDKGVMISMVWDVTERKLAEDALRDGEAFKRAILDSVTAHIAVLDKDGVIVAVNEPWRRFALENCTTPGTPVPDTEIGVNYLEVCQASTGYASEGAMDALDGIRAVLEGHQTSFTLEYPCHSPDRQRCFIMTVTPLGQATQGVVITHVDITERKHGEILLALEADRSRALLELPRAAETMDERAFMQHGQEMAEQLTGSRIAFIHFVNDDQETIELVTWSRGTLEHYCQAAFDSHYPISQAGIWADALRRREAVVFNDYASAPDKHGLPEGHADLNRLITVPVIEGGLVRMMAGVGNKPEPYSDMDVETVQLIADRIWRIVRQRRADEKLLASESRYRRLFEAAKDGVLILDAETGMVVDVNPFLVKLLGYSHEEFLGRHVWDLGCLRHVVAGKEGFEDLRLHEYQRYEDMPLETSTGKEISVEFVSNVYLVDHTKVIQCNIRDITDRKQAQDALQKSKDLLQSVVENVPVRVFWKDRDLRYLGCNIQFAGDAGCSSPDKMTGKTDFEMGWKDLAEVYQADDRAVMDTGVPKIGFEEPQTTPDGDTIWLRTSKVPLRDDGNRVIGVLGIYEDITERKQAEQQLRKLAQAVEQSPESIVITNLDAEIEYVNEAFLSATGYSREEVIGANPRVLQSGRTPRETYQEMWAALGNGRPWKGEFINQRKDGGEYRGVRHHHPPAPAGRPRHPLRRGQGGRHREEAHRRGTGPPSPPPGGIGAKTHLATRRGQRTSRIGQPGKERLPGQHEPRDPHPPECHRRPFLPVAAKRHAPGTRRPAGQDRRFRAPPALHHQ